MITALCNQKGGVGKTTLTAGLAQRLGTTATPVLVVDMDPQANATRILGVELEDDMFTMLDVMSAPRPSLHEAVRQAITKPGPGWDGIDVLPAERGLASRELDNSPARESQLRAALTLLDPTYRHILIDCQPSLGLLTLNALTAADQALIVTEAHDFSNAAVNEMLTTIQLVRESYNPNLTLAGIVVNRWTANRIDPEDQLQKARAEFGTHLLEVCVPQAAAIGRAASRHVPVANTKANLQILEAYQTIANRLERTLS